MRYALLPLFSLLVACSSAPTTPATEADAGAGTVNPPSTYSDDGAAVFQGEDAAPKAPTPAVDAGRCVAQCRPYVDAGYDNGLHEDPDAGTPEGCVGMGGHCAESYVPGVMCCFK